MSSAFLVPWFVDSRLDYQAYDTSALFAPYHAGISSAFQAQQVSQARTDAVSKVMPKVMEDSVAGQVDMVGGWSNSHFGST
jgi:hypothetical protein